MVEQIMYIGIGFLVAGLFVIGVIPLVHARAVRLTIRLLEDVTPHTRGEIRPDKDNRRADFAMTKTRIEINLDQVKVKTTNQLAELGRTISRLKLELGEKTAALQTVQAELAAKASALEEAERALASRTSG